MQPLILAEQTRQGVADFLETTFPATTPGFEDLVARFLAEPGNLAKGPYVTVGLPFRKQIGGKKAFEWLSDNFIPHAHQARSFARLANDEPLSTLVATESPAVEVVETPKKKTRKTKTQTPDSAKTSTPLMGEDADLAETATKEEDLVAATL